MASDDTLSQREREALAALTVCRGDAEAADAVLAIVRETVAAYLRRKREDGD